MPFRLFLLLSPLLGFFALFVDVLLRENALPPWLPTLISFSCFALPSLVLAITLYFTPKPLRGIFTFSGIFPAFTVSLWVVWMTLFGPPDPSQLFAIFVVPTVGLVAMPVLLLLGYVLHKHKVRK